MFCPLFVEITSVAEERDTYFNNASSDINNTVDTEMKSNNSDWSNLDYKERLIDFLNVPDPNENKIIENECTFNPGAFVTGLPCDTSLVNDWSKYFDNEMRAVSIGYSLEYHTIGLISALNKSY